MNAPRRFIIEICSRRVWKSILCICVSIGLVCTRVNAQSVVHTGSKVAVKAGAGINWALNKDTWFGSVPFSGIVPAFEGLVSFDGKKAEHMLSLVGDFGVLNVPDDPDVSVNLKHLVLSYSWRPPVYTDPGSGRLHISAGPGINTVFSERKYAGLINAPSVRDIRLTIDGVLTASFAAWEDMSGLFEIDCAFSVVSWYNAVLKSVGGNMPEYIRERNGVHFPFRYSWGGIRAGYSHRVGESASLGLEYSWAGFLLQSAYPISESRHGIRLTYTLTLN